MTCYCCISADNFKSLEANKTEKKVDDDGFEQQRKATIAEALQAKEDGTSKKFGGGQKQVGAWLVLDNTFRHFIHMGESFQD